VQCVLQFTPILIAVLYAIFDRNVLIIAFVQVLIDTLTAVLIYLFGLRLVSEQAARIGGLGYALSLGPAVHTVFILTETLFTLILLCAILTLSFYRDRNRRHWLLGGGILIGMAILIRPIALFFPLIALNFIWAAHPNKWRRIIANGFVFLVTVAVVAVPWVIRNYWTIGTLTVSTISSHNLLFYNAVSLSADLQGISQAQARATLQEQVNEELMDRGWVGNEALSAQLYTKWSRKIILSAPVRYMYIHLKNDVNSFLPSITDFLELLGFTQGGKGTLSVLNQQGLLAAVNHYFEGKIWFLWTLLPFMVLLGLIYLGTVVGIVFKILQRRWYSLALLFLPVAYLILLPGAPSNPRFRVPAMPYICLLAGTGLTFIMQHCWGRWQLFRPKKQNACE
jgi:4-amino-4-deoxy-L-arabinose transferase-like glycosyltransferase